MFSAVFPHPKENFSTILTIMLIVTITMSPLSILIPSIALGQEQPQEQEPTPILSKPTVFKVLPKSNATSLGTEPENKDNWITANHDIFGTRHSNQTTIGKDNVTNL